MKSPSAKRNKRRTQRYRSAIGLNGIERGFGLDVRIRDFSLEALAVETAAQHVVGQPLDLEFRFGEQTLILRGTVIRTDRLPAVEGVQQYLTVVQLAWHTPPERVELAGFLSLIRKSVRPI